MYKYISTLLIALILVACQSGNKRTLTGTLKGADGSVPAKAHIHIFSLGHNPFQDALSYEVSADGSFKVPLPAETYLEVLVTATDHPSLQFQLITESNKSNVSMDIQLAAPRYNQDLSQLRITGSWNDFSFKTAEPFEKQADGTFLFRKEMNVDTVQYQLVNLTANGHSVNGQDADEYIYDGGGDYLSQVLIKNKLLEVRFDPKKLIRGKTKSTVTVTSDQADLAKIIDLALEGLRVKEQEQLARKRYFSQQKSMAGFVFAPHEFLNKMRSLVKTSPMELVRDFAALQLGRFTSPKMKDAKRNYQLVTKQLPVDNPLWAAEGFGVNFIYKEALGEKKASQLFREKIDEVDNKGVRAGLLIHLGFEAKKNRDIEEQRRIYNELKNNYTDVADIGYYVSQLNPNQRIAVGNRIPDFEVPLLSGKGKVSNKSLAGKFYMMDFWATWCGPCVSEMPALHEAYEKFKNKNFTILSLSYDRNRDDIMPFRTEKWPMPWLHTFLEGSLKSEITNKFEVDGIPKPILVGPDGTILATESELRGESLEGTLRRFIK